jgi:hypothetical protein
MPGVAAEVHDDVPAAALAARNTFIFTLRAFQT